MAGLLSFPPPSVSAEEPERLDPAELPALVSEEPPGPDPQVPAGDFSNAPPTASEAAEKRPETRESPFDPEQSEPIDEATSATQQVFANPDGSQTAVLSPAPVRWLDEASGQWHDIRLDLVPAGEGEWRAESAAPGSPVIGRGDDGAPVVRAGSAAGEFSFRHPAGRPADAEVDGRYAVFADALDGGRDVRLSLTSEGFEEDVILPSTSSPASYELEVTVPEGVTARDAEHGVEFVGPDGSLVATYGGGLAFDSADEPSEVAVTTRLAETSADGRVVLSIGVDPGWLAADGRVAPVTIDPVFYQNTSSAGTVDTFVRSGLGAQGSSTELRVGSNNGGSTWAYSLLKWDLGSLPASNRWVSEAHVDIYNKSALTCTASGVEVYSAGGSWNTSTVWPGPAQGELISTKSFNHGFTGCGGAWESLDLTSLAQDWVTYAATNNGISLEAADNVGAGGYKTFWSGNSGSNTAPALYITWTTMPPPTTAVSPADDVVLATTTPTLSVNAVTDADGDAVSYWFKVATGSDAESGTIAAQSGWISGTSWTPPAGSLQDGVTYYWHVWTFDGTIWRDAGWVRKFTVNRRLGASGPSPFDTAGPVTVNLATGNAVVSTGSPSFPAVGGSAGLTYTYNSADALVSGLNGQYWADTNRNRAFDDGQAFLKRLDPQVSFDWSQGSVTPAMPKDDFLVRWTGFVSVPSTGTWQFGAASDDGVKVWVNNALVLDRWFEQNLGAPNYNAGVSLNAGQRYPIKVEYYESAFGAAMKLYAKSASVSEMEVPTSWLSPEDSSLPAGWSLSADGGDLAFTAAKVSPGSVVLTESDGTGHAFRWNGSEWVAPSGEYGTLTQNSDGSFTFAADGGQIFVFATDGTLQSVRSAIDDRKPAALTYTWNSANRLTAITDPVSGRSHTLAYGGGTCPTAPSGFDTSAPTNMLCSVTYWDQTETKLFYVSGQLARIEDPGGEITDFGYSNGRLSKIRDPLGADLDAYNMTPTNTYTWTLITYGGDGRVSDVELPTPSGTSATSRPGRSYDAPTVNGANFDVKVHVDGLTESGSFPWARKATYDPAGRLVADTDATGKVSTQTFKSGPGDLITSSVDPAGRKSTTHYDHADRPTDTYGPAPSGQYGTDDKPTSGNLATVPHTKTHYDENMAGLAASYWDNNNLGGAPKRFGTGVGGAGGALTKDWSTNAPMTGISADNWSARFTGDITFPSSPSGAYTIDAQVGVDDGVRVYIDNQQVISDWSGKSAADASTWGSGTVNLFARGTDDGLYWRHFNGSTWTGWVALGGTLASAPSAVSWGSNHIDVFAKGQDGGIWQLTYDSGTWSQWRSLGGDVTSAPDVASWGSNRLDVFVKGQDNRIYTKSWDGTAWAGSWTVLAGTETFKGDPTAVSWGFGRINVLARGSNDELMNKHWDGSSWSSWQSLGGALSESPEVASWGSNRLDVIARGNDNAFYVKSWNGTSWSAFTSIGGNLTTAPAAVSTAANTIFVYAQGTDNYFYQVAYNSGWGGWSGLIKNFRTGTFTPTAGKTYRVRVDTVDRTGAANVDLRWTPPSSSEVSVPGSALAPRYGLVTSTEVTDGRASGGKIVTATSYAHPENGVATATTEDPLGTTPLTTATAYEDTINTGTGWARRTSRTMPGGGVTTTDYYGDTQMVDNPCTVGTDTANQAGMAKTTTSPDPDGGGTGTAIVREQVYDEAGRVVASWIGTGALTCVTYDSRGRPESTVIPAFGGALARTVTNTYSVGGDPRVTSIGDGNVSGSGNSTITSTVDALGRMVSYTDVWAKTTTTAYDQAGFVRTATGPSGTGALTYDYDEAGREPPRVS